jgi:guanylate kinase
MLDERVMSWVQETSNQDRRANEIISEMRTSARPRLFVISGPSGVGKDTVIEYLRPHVPDFHFATTATTRSRRPGEIDGMHYIFLTEAEFRSWVGDGEFVEHAMVYDHLYGVPRRGIRSGLETDRHTVVKVDVQGAATIRSLAPSAILIYLMPPSMEELIRRICFRKTEEADVIIRRIQTARSEISAARDFDYVVVNDHVEVAVEQIMAILSAEQLKVNQQKIVL